MAEYIERDVAKDELLSWAVCIKHPEHLMKEDAMHILDSIPAADVVEVVHGRNLKEDTPSLFECSVCHWECWDTIPGDTDTYNYCPNCGARMGKEKEPEG